MAQSRHAFAAVPNGPSQAAVQAERVRGQNAWRATRAMTITGTRDTICSATSGARPAAGATPSRQAKPAPKPKPAITASEIPAESEVVSEPSEDAAISQVAGSAAAMPITARVPGRSPVARPVATGTSAVPTAEIGATTPIRPVDSPRKRKAVPTPTPRPDAEPHSQSEAVGAPPSTAAAA